MFYLPKKFSFFESFDFQYIYNVTIYCSVKIEIKFQLSRLFILILLPFIVIPNLQTFFKNAWPTYILENVIKYLEWI